MSSLSSQSHHLQFNQSASMVLAFFKLSLICMHGQKPEKKVSHMDEQENTTKILTCSGPGSLQLSATKHSLICLVCCKGIVTGFQMYTDFDFSQRKKKFLSNLYMQINRHFFFKSNFYQFINWKIVINFTLHIKPNLISKSQTV